MSPQLDVTYLLQWGEELERHIAQLERLRDAALEQTQILERITDGFVALDRGWRFTYVNAAAARIRGATPRALIGKNLWEVCPDFLGTPAEVECHRAVAEQLPVHFEYSFDRQAWFEFHVYPSLEGITIYFRDITDQKHMQAALKASEERYRLIADTAREGIWIIDTEGRTVFANRQMAAMLGTNAGEMPGESSFEYVFPEDAELARSEFDLKKLGNDRRFDFRLRRKDGTSFWASISGVPIHDASGTLAGLLGMFTDITERKQAEEAMARQADELAHSNAELRQFAYSTSHDLAEPLRGIINYAQLLQQRYQGQLGEGNEFVDYIHDSANRMHSLLNDLLAYAQIVNIDGLPMSKVDLNATVTWALMNLRTSIDEHKAAIQVPELPAIIGNQSQLVQLFQNLLSNAIKYRSEKPPIIRVNAEEDADAWVFSVTDNGLGIDPLYHQAVFAPFKRLHGREIPGTGIGLSMCKRIVENHGGRIWLDSERGRGSTFYFTLPVG